MRLNKAIKKKYSLERDITGGWSFAAVAAGLVAYVIFSLGTIFIVTKFVKWAWFF